MTAEDQRKQEDVLQLMEGELFELEGYIKDIWEFIPVPMAYINPQGLILDIDASLENLLGIAKEDLVGSPLQDHFSSKEVFPKIHNDTLKNSQVSNLESGVLDREGNEIPVAVSTMSRKDEAGNHVGYFAAFSDLRAVRSMKEQIKEKLKELEAFHDVAVGRELRMIEIEKEVDDLLRELGRQPKFNKRR